MLLFVLLWYSGVLNAQESLGKIKTVVLDAGHGGQDPGAVGSKCKEKDIVLDVVLRTGAMIKQHYPDIKVIYTRDTDVFVKLIDRARIANSNHADLFISVHCNAAQSTSAHGAETFVMGLSKSADNLETAKKENAAILLEANYTENYDGFDPTNDEDYIAMTLFQSASLDQSLRLAEKVQNQLTGGECKRIDRGVQQAGFLVLYKVSVPSILVELGFLSNATEEAFLRSENGKRIMSNALFTAFQQYKTEREANSYVAPATVKETTTLETPVYYVQIAASPKKMNIRSFKNVTNVVEKYVNGNYVYLTAKSDTSVQAKNKLSGIRSKGYKDAFIVAFLGEKRISVQEAETLH